MRFDGIEKAARRLLRRLSGNERESVQTDPLEKQAREWLRELSGKLAEYDRFPAARQKGLAIKLAKGKPPRGPWDTDDLSAILVDCAVAPSGPQKFNKRVREETASADSRIVARAFVILFDICAKVPKMCDCDATGAQILQHWISYPPKLADDDILAVARSCDGMAGSLTLRADSLGNLIERLQKREASAGPLRALAEVCRRVAPSLRTPGVPLTPAQIAKFDGQLDAVLADRPSPIFLQPFEQTDADLQALLDHCRTAAGVRPSAKWERTAKELLARTQSAGLAKCLGESVAEMRRFDKPQLHSTDFLRGVAWALGLTEDSSYVGELQEALEVGGEKLPGIGPRCEKLFSGALWALARLPGYEPLAAMSRSRRKIRTNRLCEALDAALEAAAEGRGLGLDVLEEMIVPTYGLDPSGVRVEKLGDVEARLELVGASDIELKWSKDGKVLKSAPAAAKEFAEELADLKKIKKEAAATLSAQRLRLESLFMQARTISYRDWRERYLDHPLLTAMVRRLIWRFDSGAGGVLGIPLNGEPLDAEKRPLDRLDECAVSLWHPMGSGLAAVEVWRDFVVREEVRQPFKQAFREVYILTDAERATAVYSNRFAAHILKQHQFAALARARGWAYTLQGQWDGGEGGAALRLRRRGLTAYFDAEPGLGDAEVADSGIALYVATDKVGFRNEEHRAVELGQVEPIVFSEVMRDVDLFVAVAGVGNDPTWADTGPEGRRTYWESTAFGELPPSAESRKAALERLLPLLPKLRSAHMDGRFLVVPGHLRTYKIHLGSGNILMSPNDQYLCIVPGFATDGKAANKLYVPFEGDRILDVILSKALLLADDDKIKDPTIVQQIK